MYRVQQATDPGNNHAQLQLIYDQTLVLRVNRDTGELNITNPLGGQIAIDGYTVSSSLGSLQPAYHGISGTTPTPPDADWAMPIGVDSAPLNSSHFLTEIKRPDFTNPIDFDAAFDLSAIPMVSLGAGFSSRAVAQSAANFGVDGEDLVFEYSSPGREGVIRGQIEYVGTKFENDLVLQVDPATGQAALVNDSLATLKVDGYAVLSSTGALSGAGWSGVGGAWEKSSPATANALTESNPTGALTLAPGESVAIGDIGSFGSEADQEGLRLQFILAESLVASGTSAGDFDGDGRVAGNDFLQWQRDFGGARDSSDLAAWAADFGGAGGARGPEATFRTGSVAFTTGSVAIAVPEPATWLVGATLAVLCVVRRCDRRRTRAASARGAGVDEASMNPGGRLQPSNEIGLLSGGGAMKRLRPVWATSLVVVIGVLATSEVAKAATQGIPLVNSRFESPGPVGTKTVAFDATGAPIVAVIPGWTFVGPGVEDFGDGVPGDSGVEGGGNPDNELLLSTHDGVVTQSSSFAAVSIPATQQYLLRFDAHEIFTINADNTVGYTGQGRSQLTTRLYYGPAKTTLATLVVEPSGGFETYEISVPGGAAALTPALGQTLGVEFDVTSLEFNAGTEFDVQHSWVGVDNVLLEIAGTTAGDLNGDGVVDLADYRILRDNQQESHDFLSDGELTGDGFVDLNDFRVWKSLPAVVSSGVLNAISVPEPTSAALMLAAFGLLARRRGPSSGERRTTSSRRATCFAALAAT
ncbi:MAG: PEP-CTERM sorting domain-containing protein, partial [Planctomycetales bacterium]|nr:PEP-CTERM sorting domain-containing protein [Planctomycetales bacterium]